MTTLPELRTSLRSRLFLGMGVMLVPIVALAVLSFLSSRAMVDAVDEVVAEQELELHPVTHLLRLVQQAGMPPHDYLITASAAERVAFEQLAAQTDAAFLRLQSANTFGEPAEQRLFQEAMLEWTRARQLGRELLLVPSPTGNADAARRMKTFDVHLDQATEALGALYDQVLREVTAYEERARAVRDRETALLVAMAVLAVALAVGAAVVLSRSIVGPVRALQDGILAFGAGDHSFRVPLRGGDEFAQLADTMNRLADRLEHDQLTGVASRSALQRRLRAEVPRARRFQRPFSVVMIDVDHFKHVNDVHGHAAGDEALRAVAARLAAGLRMVDTVARYGGEEFAVILPETAEAGALVLAERLRAAVAGEPIAAGEGVTIPITVSLGVATFPTDALDDARLLSAADRALYAAKQWGRNRVVAAAEVDASRERPAAAAGTPRDG